MDWPNHQPQIGFLNSNFHVILFNEEKPETKLKFLFFS